MWVFYNNLYSSSITQYISEILWQERPQDKIWKWGKVAEDYSKDMDRYQFFHWSSPALQENGIKWKMV